MFSCFAHCFPPKLSDDIKLDFTDVLITPCQSNIQSRKDVCLEVTLKFKHSDRHWVGVPIMIANMDTTGTIEICRVAQKYKIITCLHKFYKADDIPDDLDPDFFAISTGTRKEDLDNLDIIVQKTKARFICLDIANGYSTHILDAIKTIRAKYPHITLIAGNVVTPEMAYIYDAHGVDIIKMGIGSGSVCTTRLQTGVGYPQFSCICDTRASVGNGMHIISDGGIQYSGDISKAFGAGATFVMIGGLFAGHDESSGDIVIDETTKEEYKVFYGMSSDKAMVSHYGKVDDYRVAEGKCVRLKRRGPVEKTIQGLLGGVRSSLAYVGAKNLCQFPDKVRFIRVNHVANKMYNGREI